MTLTRRLTPFMIMVAFAAATLCSGAAARANHINLPDIQPMVASGPTPSPIAVGDQTKWGLSVNAGSPQKQGEAEPGNPSYGWSYSAQTSADSKTYTAAPSGSYDIHFDDASIASPTLYATLKSAAYWKITVTASVSYKDKNGSGFTWSGRGSCDAKVTVISATLTAQKTRISAKSSCEITAAESQTPITIVTQPGGQEQAVQLSVKEVTTGPPSGDGTLKGSGANWTYTAYDEPKTEKHPRTRNVTIVPKVNGKECGSSITVVVVTAFIYLTNPPVTKLMGHTGAGPSYMRAYKFIRCKYSCINNSGGTFKSVTIEVIV